jgi:hypothetical protein
LTPAAQSSKDFQMGASGLAADLDGTSSAATSCDATRDADTRFDHGIADTPRASGDITDMTGQLQGTGGNTVTTSPRLLDARWALRRALLGLAILAVGIAGMAWLTHASINPALETPAIAQTSP